MNLLTRLINLIVYSNAYIAIGAFCMVLCSQLNIPLGRAISPVSLFVFFSTLSLYAFHRLVGINKTKSNSDKGRFAIIENYQIHILFYAIVALVISLFFLFQLKWISILTLSIPAILSIAYVSPIFGNGRRLRDLPFIKVFIIAFSWSILTVVIPYLEHTSSSSFALPQDIQLLTLERFFFLLFITIPFDIRDRIIDRKDQIKTIATQFGEFKAKWIAFIFGLTYLGINCLLYYSFGMFSIFFLIAHLVCFLAGSILIYKSSIQRHDYFYSILLDGLLIVQYLLLIVFSSL